MSNRTDDFRKQINDLWKQAVAQLDEVKDVLNDRIEADSLRLRKERDRLLQSLGEQTYKLAHQDKLPLPASVKKTVDRLTEVIDGLVAKKGGAKKKAAKKKATKKKTAKKKTTKKKA